MACYEKNGFARRRVDGWLLPLHYGTAPRGRRDHATAEQKEEDRDRDKSPRATRAAEPQARGGAKAGGHQAGRDCRGAQRQLNPWLHRAGPLNHGIRSYPAPGRAGFAMRCFSCSLAKSVMIESTDLSWAAWLSNASDLCALPVTSKYCAR